MPRESAVVVSLNVPRLRDTAMWRKLLDARDRSPESKKRVADFTQATGLDPFTQIDGLVAGFPAQAQGGAAGDFGVVVRGTFDSAKLVAWAQGEARKRGQDVVTEDYQGTKLYHERDSYNAVAFLDAHTLILASRDWAHRMLDLAAGRAPESAKGSAKDNAELTGLMRKTRTGDALWLVGVVSDAARGRIASTPGLEGLKSLKTIYGSLDFATGLRLELALDLPTDADAQGLNGQLQLQLTEAKKNTRTALLGITPFLNDIKPDTDKSTFRLSINYNQAQVDQLLDRAQALLPAIGFNPNPPTP
ncbi:MAG TPA: hypothetical protein VH877_32070 [Polyangia bacterium]|nr:hypothetical protein [Polyangia bacterium]